MNKREVGTQKEQLAAAFLEEKGCHIVCKNFRSRIGEIDLIGYHKGYLVFIEVKFRSTARYGNPQDAVNLKKQQIICKVADYYKCTHSVRDCCPVRFDVLAICGDKIDWYQNAFDYR